MSWRCGAKARPGKRASSRSIPPPADLVQRASHVPRRGQPGPLRVGEVEDRVRDEGQRPPSAQGLPHQGGIDVGDAVGEAVCAARRAVVHLVRVQDVALARQAPPRRAAVAGRLHAREPELMAERAAAAPDGGGGPNPA